MSALAHIRRAAYYLLARRDHSVSELIQKLKLKNFNVDEIKLVLTALTAEKILDEKRFIDNFIHARQQKGYGPLRIQMELRARGVPEDLIEENLKIKDNIWLEIIQSVWKKRFKHTKAFDFKMRSRAMRFLQYRGFTHEQINSVFHDDN